MKMPFFYAKDQGEEEKLSASHNIKNGQNYGSTFLRSCLNEKDVGNDISCIYSTVFKNHKKMSHLTLRAKRATFAF